MFSAEPVGGVGANVSTRVESSLVNNTNGSRYLDWSSDALLVPPQTFAFLPAHGLQHFVSNVVTAEAIFGGLFIVAGVAEKSIKSSKNNII